MNHGVGADIYMPLSALGPVQQALMSVHAAVGLHATLQAIAEGVTTSTPYQDVAVTAALEPDAEELHVIAVIAPPEARELLLGTTARRDALLEHLAGGEQWGSLRFRPGTERTDGIITYSPTFEPVDAPDAWLPHYELNAPLHDGQGKLVGMVSMDRPRGGRIPPRWVNEVLELFAEQAAIAILNARRHELALREVESLKREKAALDAAYAEQCARETNLRTETRRDPLTGLANRVLLKERLEELLAARVPLAVVFCDLDHFKQINDSYGHAVGDEVLRSTGERLTGTLRDLDVVARVGGDEFVIVAAGMDEGEAPKLLQRIEEAFAAEPISAMGLLLPVQSSLGLACEPGRKGPPFSPSQRAEELLDRADHEMYAHKRSRVGVNRLLALADRR